MLYYIRKLNREGSDRLLNQFFTPVDIDDLIFGECEETVSDR